MTNKINKQNMGYVDSYNIKEEQLVRKEVKRIAF